MSFDEEDDVSMFETGINLQDESAQLKRLRLILDTVSPLGGYRKLAALHADVKEWLAKVDNKRASLEYRLTGVKRSWLKAQLKKFKDNCDNVSPMGEPLEGVKDPCLATDYSPYAVEAHRTMINRAAHGELDAPDEYRQQLVTDQNFDDTPRWMRGKVFIGKFCRVGFTKKWVDDIRIGQEIGGKFDHISKFLEPWAIADNKTVKEFKDRWYNDPQSLTLKKVGYGDRARWAMGMIVKSGNYMWAPMTHRSSQYFDWRVKNDGKTYHPKLVDGLTKDDKIVTYQKRKDHMFIRLMKEDDQTGMWAVWATIKMTYDDARGDYLKRLKEGWKVTHI